MATTYSNYASKVGAVEVPASEIKVGDVIVADISRSFSRSVMALVAITEITDDGYVTWHSENGTSMYYQSPTYYRHAALSDAL